MAAPNLFSFQGKVYLAQRQSTGKPGPLRWVGNAPQLELALEVQNSDKFESFSGNRLLYGRLVQSKTANVNLTLDEATPENLAEGLYSIPATLPAGSVNNELLPPGLKANDLIALDRGWVSDVAITDSANPPVTVPAANWWTESASGGVIGLRKVDGLTQPFKASYKHGETVNIALFNTPPPERMLILDGINTVTGQRAKVTLYRLTFNPIEQLALISEEWGSLQLSGAALFDESRALDPDLGGFGRIELARV
ncbi:hypothetical protein [Lysobacter antibioticus]|uniref:phage tail tube protein n=1 Tax=Lysobacter antibioticus TaxID=84531 RepID=UPI00034754BB|nr:hypothetical protein [Lysobacter antibioticus]